MWAVYHIPMCASFLGHVAKSRPKKCNAESKRTIGNSPDHGRRPPEKFDPFVLLSFQFFPDVKVDKLVKKVAGMDFGPRKRQKNLVKKDQRLEKRDRRFTVRFRESKTNFPFILFRHSKLDIFPKISACETCGVDRSD